MSKVKIQGNASGTGVLTVTAPNTSTDRVITLPDATGTLLNSDGDGSSLTGVGVAGITSSADATAITIDSSERVGIGAAPASGIALTISKDGTGADLAGIRLIDSNSGNDQQIYNYQGNLYFRDSTAGVTRLRVDADGLKFGNDTAEANALYDYESGTWTPNLSVKPSGVALGTVTVANYTKIGDRVFISLQCQITSSSVPAPNNDMRIIGFPFTNANSGVNMPAIFNYNYKETPQLHINGSGYLYFQDTTVGGNNQSPAGGGLDASTTLSLAIQYKTNS